MPNPSTLAASEEGLDNSGTNDWVSMPKTERDALVEQAHTAHEFGKILDKVRDILDIAPERPLIPVIENMKQELRILKGLNHELHLEMQDLLESRDTIRSHAQAALDEYRKKS